MPGSRRQFTVTDDLVATLQQRFLNWFLDTIMLVLLSVFFIVIIAAIAGAYGNKTLPVYLISNPIGQFTFVTVIRLIYYVFLETLVGSTIGKLVSQTKVVDVNGNLASHETILIRTLCRLIPFYEISFFGIPPRGWHDSISKTYVVDKRKLEEAQRNFYRQQQSENE
ncbi:MAG: RDD family protein [Flavobacterium sp.]